jgi:hypothetical protein
MMAEQSRLKNGESNILLTLVKATSQQAMWPYSIEVMGCAGAFHNLPVLCAADTLKSK